MPNVTLNRHMYVKTIIQLQHRLVKPILGLNSKKLVHTGCFVRQFQLFDFRVLINNDLESTLSHLCS